MIMKNKFLKTASLLIVAILLVTTFSACSSYDEDYAIYDLWVAGVKVTTRNRTDILGDGTVSYVGDGKSGTLTLNGTNIAECSDEDAEAFIISTIDHLTINLVGENKLGMGEKAPVSAISGFDMTIKGEGSLAIGARASCIKSNELTVESGKITTYIKTAEDEIASFIGVGLWAQELLTVNGGDIEVHYDPEFSALSYGLYCVKDITVNDGSITIKEENAAALGVGMEDLLKSIETALGHSRHHVVVTLPYSMGGMVDTLHSGAQVLNVDYTAEGIEVETILDPILYGKLKDYITI